MMLGLSNQTTSLRVTVTYSCFAKDTFRRFFSHHCNVLLLFRMTKNPEHRAGLNKSIYLLMQRTFDKLHAHCFG